jgi:ATP-dependent Clp protease adaptor protein ClpS
MALKFRSKYKTDARDLESIGYGIPGHLVLHNDNVNTFEFVVETLVEVCNHNHEQAEQCAVITHYKGKCDIKNGSLTNLQPIKNELILRGLTATIDF